MKSNNHIIGITTCKGYSIVRLLKNEKKHTKNIHRLVAEYFIPDFDEILYVEHIEKNKSNNVVSNLKMTNNLKKCLNRQTKIIDLTDFDKL